MVIYCEDCNAVVPKTKYSKKFKAYLCTECRKRRLWNRRINMAMLRKWRYENRERKRIEAAMAIRTNAEGTDKKDDD